MYWQRLLSLALVLLATLAASLLAGEAEHWAFRAPERPALPGLDRSTHPIDAFVDAARLERGLTRAAEAPRRTLMRRLSLTLRGLTPTPEEMKAFVADGSPEAYSTLVEHMLASPQYGERWARHWLDVARFAESEGYGPNNEWSNMWRYRDYVVRSFNEDKPFSRFVLEQLAGDELPDYRDEHIIATGFLSTARISGDEGSNIRQFNDLHVDIVNATTSAFLGLTMACAQCHDHKFDPLTLRDYYQLQAFFTQGLPGRIVLETNGSATDPRREDLRKSSEELRQLTIDVRRYVLAEGYDLEPEPLRAMLHKPEDERTVEEETLYRKARGRLNIRIAGCNAFRIKEEDTRKLNELKGKVESLAASVDSAWAFYSPVTSPHELSVLPMEANFPLLHNEQELRATRAYVYERGDPYKPTEVVEPGFPAIFGPSPEEIGEAPRTALARWLTRRDHPLTARVWVNRIWHYVFGRGLVKTPGNFGTRSAPPSHPELLDWLAVELMENNWSTKHILRLVVNSKTFRQSSLRVAENAGIDPENAYLWRWQRRRLEGEAIRDVILEASGQLNRRLGGPSAPSGQDDRSRSLYLFQKRAHPPSMIALFDGPTTMSQSCATRSVSTSPLQPLYLLNNAFLLEEARSLAQRVTTEAGEDIAKQVEVAFDLTLQRQPDALERSEAEAFLRQNRENSLPRIVDIDVPKVARELANGDAVAVWGNHHRGRNKGLNDLRQSVRTRLPTYVEDPKGGINGRPVIRFSGGFFGQSDHLLEAPDSDELDMTHAYTAIVAMRFNGPGQNNQIVYMKARNGGNDLGCYALFRDPSGHITVGQNIAGVWGDRLKSSKPVAFTVPVVMMVCFDGEELQLEIHTSEGLLCRDSTPLPGEIDPGEKAGRFSVGGYTDAFSPRGERMNGDIGELLLFQSALDGARRRELTELLSKKWLFAQDPGRHKDEALPGTRDFLSLWLRADSRVDTEPSRMTLVRDDPKATFSLFVRVGYDDYRPDPAHATATYTFEDPVEVAGLEAVVHTNGILEIEGFSGDQVETLESIGRASSSAAGRDRPYRKDRATEIFTFDPAKLRTERVFRFVVRETVLAGAFASYQAFPRARDGRRFPAVEALDFTAVTPETNLALFCQSLMNLNEFLYVE